MMTRRLLFTAATRAKETGIIYNEGQCLQKAIENKAERERITLLEKQILESDISAKKSCHKVHYNREKRKEVQEHTAPAGYYEETD